jgi:hypothetical protein
MQFQPRPIEFKVWDTKTKRFRDEIAPIEAWIDSDSWDDPEELLNDPWLWQEAPTFDNRFYWLQFTGKLDIENNKIFEGDRVTLMGKAPYWIPICELYVRYDEQACQFVTERKIAEPSTTLIHAIGDVMHYDKDGQWYERRMMKYDSYRIIGNIFEETNG